MLLKNRILLLLFVLALVAGSAGNGWRDAKASNVDNSAIYEVTAGDPADLWLGNDGIYMPSSAYTGKVLLYRPIEEVLKTVRPLLRKEENGKAGRFLVVNIIDKDGDYPQLLNGFVYAYFNLNAIENDLWNEGRLVIYYYDAGRLTWEVCLANQLVDKGKHGRAVCLATRSGLYALVALDD